MEESLVKMGLGYAVWALEFFAYPPFVVISLMAVTSLIWSAVVQQPHRKHLWKPHHWFVFTHILFFIAAIIIGVLGYVEPTGRSSAHQPATFWYYAVLFGSFISCVVWIFNMKGFRWFAASLLALLEICTLSALLVAGMSISGDWL